MATLIFRFQIALKTIEFLFLLLWVYTATSKLLNYEVFQMQLSKSPFVANYSALLIWMIPLIEYVLAGLFLFQAYTLHALYLSFALMVLFTIYIVAILHFSNAVPCACGGVITTLSWYEHLIFNILFMGLALLGILLIRKKQNIIDS